MQYELFLELWPWLRECDCLWKLNLEAPLVPVVTHRIMNILPAQSLAAEGSEGSRRYNLGTSALSAACTEESCSWLTVAGLTCDLWGSQLGASLSFSLLHPPAHTFPRIQELFVRGFRKDRAVLILPTGEVQTKL